jgi:hypothetical protein
MAFTRGEANFAAHGFIPVKFSPKVLAILDKKTAAVECVNRDWEGEISDSGDIVRIRSISPVPVSSYTVDSSITYSTLSELYTDLVIDQQIYGAYKVDYVDATQTDLDVMEMGAERVEVSIRNNVDTNLTAKMVAGVSMQTTMGAPSSGSVIKLTAPDIADAYTDQYQLLQESNATFLTGEMPFTIVTPAVYALMKKSKLLNIGVTSYNGEPIDEFQGFQVKVSTNTVLNAASGGNDDYVAIISGYKFATTFALQINAEEMIEPLQTYFAKGRRFLVVWGALVTHPTGLGKMIVKV